VSTAFAAPLVAQQTRCSPWCFAVFHKAPR
jgi:hypothetical protein